MFQTYYTLFRMFENLFAIEAENKQILTFHRKDSKHYSNLGLWVGEWVWGGCGCAFFQKNSKTTN